MWMWLGRCQLAEGSLHGSPLHGVDATRGHSAGGCRMRSGIMGTGEAGL